jgi:hypothetical protein
MANWRVRWAVLMKMKCTLIRHYGHRYMITKFLCNFKNFIVF